MTCAAAAVSGEVIAVWAETMETAGSVDTLMEAEAAGLAERKHMTFIDI